MPDSETTTALCYPGQGGDDVTCVDGDDGKTQGLNENLHEHVGAMQDRSSTFEILDNKQCIENYSRSLHSERRHLLAVTRQRTKPPLQYNMTHFNSSKFGYSADQQNLSAKVCADEDIPCLRVLEGSLINFWSLTTTAPNFFLDNQTYDSSDWMCTSDSGPVFEAMDGGCVPESLNPSDWKVNAQQIEYCRSEKVEEKCRLEFSVTIGIVVVLCNGVKLAVLAFTAVRLDQRTFCTIG